MKNEFLEQIKRNKSKYRIKGLKKGVLWYTIYIVMIIYCISIMYPIIWMIINSFKNYMEYVRFPYQLPKKWIFSNYAEVFEYMYTTKRVGTEIIKSGFWDMFRTSALYSLLGPIPGIFWTTCMAYVSATFRKYWYNKLIFNIGIITMTIPLVGTLGVNLMWMKFLGTYDNLPLSVLLSAGSFSGTTFLIIRGNFMGVSSTYREAILIDGGNNWTAFFRLSLPMVSPVLFVLYFQGFVATWNSYESFLIYYPSYANLAYGMYIFQNNISLYGVGYPTVLAGFVIVAIPSVILFLLIQKGFNQNFNIGGLKG